MKLSDHIHSLQFRLTVGFAAVLAGTLFVVSGWSALSTRAAIDDYGEEVERFRAERTSHLVRDVFRVDRDLRHVQSSLEYVGRLIPNRVVLVDEHDKVLADSHGSRLMIQGHNKDWSKYDEPQMSATVDLGDGFTVKVLFYESDGAAPSEFSGLRFGDWPEGDDSTGTFSFAPRLLGDLFTGQDSGTLSIESSVDGLDVVDDSDAIDLIDQAVSELTAEPQLTALEESFQKSIVIAGGAGLIAGVLLVALFARSALSPVRSLSNAAQKLGSGDFDQRVNEDRRDELGNLARTFNSMAQDLQTAEGNRRRMTADIAHELRNPLTNIRGYLEAIKDGVLEPDEAAIDTLHGETIHLSRLVEDLQLLAIADAGELRLHKTPLLVQDVVAQSVNAAKPRAMEREIDLQLRSEGRPPLADLDPTRFAQVLGNLLDNAISHTESGGAVTVVVTSSEADGRRYSVLEVSNEGEPIAEEDLNRVFEQFYRVDRSRSRSTGGAGLGLTIVKRLVEAHGGTVSAACSDGTTTFTVTVPQSETTDLG